MTHVRTSAIRTLRLLALAALLHGTAAHADDYSEVSQLVRSGKLMEAMVKADQYLATKPRDPQMRFLKGVIQRDSGKSADAIATFTRLTEDFPELPEPYNNLAVLYAGQGQYDKARTALEMAIRTNPSYATAHENLGDVYAKLASQAYNKALQLDGSNQGVPPKLALIRELFSPTGAKNQKPTPPAVATSPTPPVAAATPKPATSAPVLAATTPTAAPSGPSPNAGNQPTAAQTGDPAQATKDAEAAVQAWARAWAARDMKAYLAAYGRDFDPPGSQSRGAWEEERRVRITSKSKISIQLQNLQVAVNGNNATARFRQDYKADGLSVSSRKTLELVRTGERWVIVKESTGT